MSTFPKWATPDRRRQLVRFWQSYGNRCLLGHQACPELSHYCQERLKAQIVGCEVFRPIRDRQDNILGHYQSFGHKQVAVPELEVLDLYTAKSEEAISEWKRDDTVERSILQKLEERRLHAAPLKTILKRGQFDSIARHIYLSNRPIFRVLAVGVNAKAQRVAKVEIPGLEKIVWVDISGMKLSKSKLRKLSRHPGNMPEAIYAIVRRRVESYL